MLKRLILVLILMASFYAIDLTSYTDNILKVYYMDIGQGDSTFIVSPDDVSMLVDGGVDKETLFELSELKNSLNRRIDVLMISHTDLDHIGGLIDIINRYEVGMVISNDKVGKSRFARYLFDLMKQKDIPIINVDSGDDFSLGCCVEIDFLWPNKGIDVSNLSENDKSISFLLKYGEIDLLFDGDLSKEYEEKMLIDMEINVDVLQVGHHGSKTSTSELFLKKIDAEVGIISTAENNKFGHPHKETLQLLENNNVNILRTDLNGRVELTSDGKGYWIKCEYFNC